MNAVWTKIISKLLKKKNTVEQRCVEFISTNDAAKALIVYSIYLECYKCDVRYSDAGICENFVLQSSHLDSTIIYIKITLKRQ